MKFDETSSKACDWWIDVATFDAIETAQITKQKNHEDYLDNLILQLWNKLESTWIFVHKQMYHKCKPKFEEHSYYENESSGMEFKVLSCDTWIVLASSGPY